MIAGCQGRIITQPKPTPTTFLDAWTAAITPVVIGDDDPCYTRVVALTRKWLGLLPFQITRTFQARFEAHTARGYVIANYYDSGMKPSCHRLEAVTIVPPTSSAERTLEFSNLSVRRLTVAPSSSGGGATITVTDRRGRRYVKHLVSQPFAFVVNYAVDNIELYGPGPGLLSHRISTDAGSRVHYELGFKKGFWIYGPVYNQ